MINDDFRFQEIFVSSAITNKIDAVLSDQIIPVGKLDQGKVLEVYHQDYFSRLTEALCQTFEAVWAAIGDESFFLLAREYINKYPSEYKSLNDLGLHMPQFLSQHELLSDYPFLEALASFELGYWKIFHTAKEYSSVNFDEIELPTLLKTQFLFPRNMTFFQWPYKIYDIWKKRNEGFGEDNLDYDSDQQVILFKTSKMVEVLELTPAQYKILEAMKNQHSLEQALEKFPISNKEIQTLFGNIKDFGLFIQIIPKI